MGDKTRRIAFQVQLVSSPLNFGSVEPVSGLRKREKNGGGGGRGKKEKKKGRARRALVPGKNLSQLIQNTKSTRLVRGEQESKGVKLNTNNNTPKIIKATGVLLINRTDKQTFFLLGI